MRIICSEKVWRKLFRKIRNAFAKFSQSLKSIANPCCRNFYVFVKPTQLILCSNSSKSNEAIEVRIKKTFPGYRIKTSETFIFCNRVYRRAGLVYNYERSTPGPMGLPYILLHFFSRPSPSFLRSSLALIFSSPHQPKHLTIF